MRLLPGIALMGLVVVTSNILVNFLILDGLLTWGAVTYPIAFLITDVTNRWYGPAAARRVVLAGFVTGILCSLIGTQVQLEYGPAVTLRVAVASGAGFLAAQLLDVGVFDRLRQGSWWRAPLASTLVGASVDTALFFTISFAGFISFGPAADAATAWGREAAPLLLAGPEVPLWVSLALADWCVKITLAMIALIPFRLIIRQRPSAPA
ncbi:queuosine precursor transporter [Pseudoroseicyclus aestuarii]|uniref:Probable queuosine precursor transporter n=1 Tax=Pseudoroseicyclus aestuarii TaxID=1795041 RepID=A0A318SR61_9RHOB|nr:queuosine precursor transporter [Pseudoroseicyclus aestuarii]PYE84300.1 hypothetical protein DFP88_10295 [Pseudoroseicyclus aestuarii]